MDMWSKYFKMLDKYGILLKDLWFFDVDILYKQMELWPTLEEAFLSTTKELLKP